MTGAHRRQGNWTPEEDLRLLGFVEAGKSWVFISANLRRPANSARNRLAFLLSEAKKLTSIADLRASNEGEEMLR
jgi:hypothetical protein